MYPGSDLIDLRDSSSWCWLIVISFLCCDILLFLLSKPFHWAFSSSHWRAECQQSPCTVDGVDPSTPENSSAPVHAVPPRAPVKTPRARLLPVGSGFWNETCPLAALCRANPLSGCNFGMKICISSEYHSNEAFLKRTKQNRVSLIILELATVTLSREPGSCILLAPVRMLSRFPDLIDSILSTQTLDSY